MRHRSYKGYIRGELNLVDSVIEVSARYEETILVDTHDCFDTQISSDGNFSDKIISLTP